MLLTHSVSDVETQWHGIEMWGHENKAIGTSCVEN